MEEQRSGGLLDQVRACPEAGQAALPITRGHGGLPRDRFPTGRLAVAAAGLSPTSRRQLAGHTNELLGGPAFFTPGQAEEM